MSPKLPVKGTLTNDPHPRSTPPSHPGPRSPGTSSAVETNFLSMTATEPPGNASGVRPATSAVTVSRTPSGAALVTANVRRSLEDYWITTEARLPAADTQGLRTFKGRRYVDIPGGHIVEVAIDPGFNLYRARLASERYPSGPVLRRDHQSKLWVPLDPSSGSPILRPIEVLNSELDNLSRLMRESTEIGKQLERAVHAQEGKEGQRAALALFELQCHKHLVLLEQTHDFFIREQVTLLLYKGATAYQNELFNIQSKRFEIYSEVMLASDTRKRLEIPADTQLTLDHRRSMASYLKSKLGLLRKRQIIAEEILKKSHYSKEQLAELEYDPLELHETLADWLYTKSHLLAAELADSAVVYYALSFSELMIAFRNIDNIPLAVRTAVLSDLIDQCTSIRASYEYLEFPPTPAQLASRQEMIEAVKSFENTLEERMLQHHQDLESAPLSLPPDQSIDFDFIPAQGKNQPAPSARRMFRSKHHGVFKIRVGRPRRSAINEELIDVMHPHRPAEILQTYERQDGEWQRRVVTEEKNLAKLSLQAEQHLDLSDQHLRVALRDEAAKHNATSIVDFLGAKAEILDDLCLGLGRATKPVSSDIAALIARLKHDSQRLRGEGEAIRIRLYKDQDCLSADRVVYLMRHDELRVKRTQNRLVLGKGQSRDFLDVYSLNDRHTGKPLWEAHFHYAKKDTPALDFKRDGGHLKTLEQARLGSASQRRDELAGRPHLAIWRLTLDTKTAQKIFAMAS